jgi:hypothetical protein
MDAAPILFLVCLLLLLAFATKKDRAALWIITISNVVGWLLVIFVTRQIHAPWKLVIPAGGETLTILALIGIGRNRSSLIQASLLLIAWLSHVLCYVDCQTGSNLVYDHYEQILAGVAVCQLLGFHDTASHCFTSARDWLLGYGSRGVRVSSVGPDLLHTEGDPKL